MDINIDKVVSYNLSIEDLKWCLAACCEPLKGFIIHTKKDNRYWVFDPELDEYCEL